MSPHAITVTAALATAVAAVWGVWLVRGTTAVPAAMWATLASVALALEAGCTEAGWLQEPSSRAAFRLVVASLAVCPTMSILGAKRPQHGVWQLIVATLACVLMMPAVTAVLVRPGSMPDLHLIERCFLPVLVVVGWLNYAATRRSLAASFVAIGQLGLMWMFLPGVAQGESLTPELDAGAAVLVAVGAWLSAAQSAFWPVGANRLGGLAAEIDAPFLALRETLGAVWTLRIVERFNAVAQQRGWPARLRFWGVVVDAREQGDLVETELNRLLRSLLRRFASTAWLERHADPGREMAHSARGR